MTKALRTSFLPPTNDERRTPTLGCVAKKKATSARAKAEEVGDVTATILDVAGDMLEGGGLDGLQLRDVAAQARVSLTTVYKHFASRDDLVVAAVERWMTANVDDTLTPRRCHGHLAEELIAFLHQFFAPWAKNPTMLTVFLHAALLPGGDRLATQGIEATSAHGEGLLAGYDPDFAFEVETILGLLTEGMLKRFSAGQLDMDQVLDIYERAVRRLTAGVEPMPPVGVSRA